MVPLGVALALALLRWEVRSVRPTREEVAVSVLASGQLAAVRKKPLHEALLQWAADSEKARLELAGVHGAGVFIDEVLSHAQESSLSHPEQAQLFERDGGSVPDAQWDAALAAVPDDALEAAIAELTSAVGFEQPAEADPLRTPATWNVVKALVEKSTGQDPVEAQGAEATAVAAAAAPAADAAAAAAPGAPAQGAAPEQGAEVGQAPCNDVSSQVGLNCGMPPGCDNLPNKSAVPEIQLGVQRVLEKCYEYHNRCKAAAHEFLGMAAKRRLLMAKTQLMKKGVSLAKKQYHERIARLKEKNATIILLSAGVGKMNVTVRQLQAANSKLDPPRAPTPASSELAPEIEDKKVAQVQTPPADVAADAEDKKVARVQTPPADVAADAEENGEVARLKKQLAEAQAKALQDKGATGEAAPTEDAEKAGGR